MPRRDFSRRASGPCQAGAESEVPLRAVLPRILVTGGAMSLAFGLAGGTAYAAGSGYGSGTGSAPGATGGYTNVVSAQSVPASGGTVSATVNGAKTTVTVPAGDFSAPVQVVFIAGAPTTSSTSGVGGTPELAFGIQIDQGGQKLAGPYTHAIQVTITSSSITAGGTVDLLTGSGYTPATGWTVTNGSATGSFSVDVDYLITSGTATTTVSGATTPHTGEPFLGEGILAAALCAVGALGAWRWHRSRAGSLA